MTTLLFFDDFALNRRDCVDRRIGGPRLIEGAIYRDPTLNTHSGYPTVFRDETSGIWRMTYQGWTEGGPKLPLLAESQDGLHFQPRDTTAELSIPDRHVPHQLIPLEKFREWGSTYTDRLAEPAHRYKALINYRDHEDRMAARLLTSPDGLHWNVAEGVRWRDPGADPGAFSFWNDVRKRHVIVARPRFSERRLALIETRDWQTFTQPELCVQADALDTPLAETYGMYVLPYEGYYIGLLWIYHVDRGTELSCPAKYWGGRMDCQLAYSHNGWHFQRTLRDAFVPNGAPGEPDAGRTYPSCAVVQENGSLRIFACASTEEHGFGSPGAGSILCHHLRQDGFIFLQSAGGQGVIGTKAVLWHGGELSLNAASPGGRVRVRVTEPKGAALPGYDFEDCQPFSGDDTAWSPAWKERRTLAALAGRALRLEVEMLNARLYAIRGKFTLLSAGELVRFEQFGEPPPAHEGMWSPGH